MCGFTGCSKQGLLGPIESSLACSGPQLPGDDHEFFAKDILGTDEFKMYLYKVLPCGKREQHDIGACPFAHSGEKAARRDLRVFKYDSSACPDVLQSGRCPRGISCNMAHSVFEYWLHPQRYRTQMCRDGASCTRKVCFFAHSDQELRHVPGISADASDPFSKAAKFSLSGMKRQKSASLAQASCGTGSSHSGSMDRSSSGGSTSSRLLFQPTYQATGLDLMSAFSGDVMSSSSTCSMGSSAYPNSMLRNSSIDLSSRSRKSSMDEYSSNLVARRSLDASMLAPAAGLYATGQLPRQCCAPGSPLPPHSTLASASSADTTARVMPGGLTAGLWVENITLPAATAGPSAVAACLGLPATANHDSNSTTDPTAYIQMLSAYQQQAETCRLQAAMADAAATAAVGKLQAICGALGWPDSGMYPQPSSLACNLTVGLEPSGLGMPGLTGVSLHSLWPVAHADLAPHTADLAVSASLALPGLSGVSLHGMEAPGLANAPHQATSAPDMAASSLQLPGLGAHELLAAAAAAAARAGLPAGSCPVVGQLHSTLLA